MQSDAAQVFIRRPCQLGEGALWDAHEQRFYFIDIPGQVVYRVHPESGAEERFELGEDVGTVVLSEDGQLLLGLRGGVKWLDVKTRTLHPLCDPEADNPDTRLNDGKCDPHGRFWVGSVVEGGTPGVGGLYCFDTDLNITRHVSGISCSNGLIWNESATRFYYIDSPTHRVDVFDYDADTGTIKNRRPVVEFPEALGKPDGMTIDTEGNLWVALWGGKKVVCLDPNTGRTLREISVPCVNVTSCAFGGPKLNRLYITTAREGQSREALEDLPLSGSVFFVDLPSVEGRAATRFGRRLKEI